MIPLGLGGAALGAIRGAATVGPAIATAAKWGKRAAGALVPATVAYGVYDQMKEGETEEAPVDEAAAQAAVEAPPVDVTALPGGNKRVSVDMSAPGAGRMKNMLEAFGQGVDVQGDSGKRYRVYTLTDREFQRLSAGGI